MFDKEYTFKGKHAQYVKDLVDDDKAKLFNRNLDVYILAPIIGLLYGRKADIDSGEITTKIFTDQLLKEQTKLKFIYRLVMLLDQSDPDLIPEMKIDRAFRQDTDEQALQKNMKIYESYVLGGVEYLHEKLFEDKFDHEEYLDALYQFVEEFNQDLMNQTSIEDISEIIRNLTN